VLILFDQNVPRKLRRFLRAHVVRTAAQMGWAERENGTLLRSAEEAGFDLILTGDRNIFYQQRRIERKIAILVISRIDWPSVVASIDAILEGIASSGVGSFTEISIPNVNARSRRRSV